MLFRFRAGDLMRRARRVKLRIDSVGLSLTDRHTAVAAAIAVFVARSLRLLSQLTEFFQRDDLFALDNLPHAITDIYQYRVFQGQLVHDAALAIRRADAFVAPGQMTPGFYVLFVFEYQATAQAPAHAGDF